MSICALRVKVVNSRDTGLCLTIRRLEVQRNICHTLHSMLRRIKSCNSTYNLLSDIHLLGEYDELLILPIIGSDNRRLVETLQNFSLSFNLLLF